MHAGPNLHARNHVQSNILLPNPNQPVPVQGFPQSQIRPILL